MKGIPAFPLRTAFELLTAIVLDAIIAVLAIRMKKSNEDMKKEHASVVPE
jgi:D-arabinose 5-phosphate isomerase GutQ